MVKMDKWLKPVRIEAWRGPRVFAGSEINERPWNLSWVGREVKM